MNTETREIRDVKELSDKERNSGVWIPVRRKYVNKQPISDADFARIVEANRRRVAKAQRRLEAQRRADGEAV
jgi:hypothetical protein